MINILELLCEMISKLNMLQINEFNQKPKCVEFGNDANNFDTDHVTFKVRDNSMHACPAERYM